MIPNVRDDLVGVEPYGAPQLDVPVALNVNENPFAPSDELAQAIENAVGKAARSLNRYPDREAMQLRESLAAFIQQESQADVSPANMWPANGSNEVMQHLLLAYGGPGRRLVTFSPTYSMYPTYCRDTFTNFSTVPRNEQFGVDRDAIDQALALNPDIVLLCTPNNPTGSVAAPEVLDHLVGAFDGLVIVDEAYAEFRPHGTASAAAMYRDRAHVVVVRTMSKAFSCAGLRLGYAIAASQVVDALRVVRLPYHLSAVTQAVATTALDFRDELLGHVELLRSERDSLTQWLRARQYVVSDSGANFVMFRTHGQSDQVWQALLNQGVLVRQTGLDQWLRVSIGTPAENIAFRHALEKGDPA